MPRYDYRRGACGASFEVARTFANADALVACPMCGGSAERPHAIPRLAQFAATVKTGGARGRPLPDRDAAGTTVIRTLRAQLDMDIDAIGHGH